jgi:hypothetical protein
MMPKVIEADFRKTGALQDAVKVPDHSSRVRRRTGPGREHEIRVVPLATGGKTLLDLPDPMRVKGRGRDGW